MDMEKELIGFMENLGADKVAFASFSGYEAEIEREYGEHWVNYPNAISYAVYFPRQLINELIDGPTRAYLTYYDTLNARINDINFRVANWLEKRGYMAYPIPASQREGESKIASIFASRTAAQLSGLGYIGKSGSVIVPEVGPRLRLGTILTNAPFQAGKMLETKCPEACMLCRDNCPSKTILGVNFEIGQAIEERLEPINCTKYLRSVRNSFGKEICGICLAVCPIGKETKRLEER